MRELRKISYADAIDEYFSFGKQLNQRDVIAVRKTVSGLVKLLFPDGVFTKDDVAKILEFAMEMRRRVKEQLKRIGGMEFYDVNFSYIDKVSFEEKYVSVPESGSSSLIPEGQENPGHVYTVAYDDSKRLSLIKLETQAVPGLGRLNRSGVGSSTKAKEAMNTAFNYLEANYKSIDQRINADARDFFVSATNLNNSAPSSHISLATLIALVSIALGKPTLDGLVILGDFTIGGTISRIDDLADTLQVALDSGAKRILLPAAAASDISSVPTDLMSSFNLIFYNSVKDAAFKALGVS